MQELERGFVGVAGHVKGKVPVHIGDVGRQHTAQGNAVAQGGDVKVHPNDRRDRVGAGVSHSQVIGLAGQQWRRAPNRVQNRKANGIGAA